MLHFICLLFIASAELVTITYRIRLEDIRVKEETEGQTEAAFFISVDDANVKPSNLNNITHEARSLPLPSCFMDTVTHPQEELSNLEDHPEQYYRVLEYTYGDGGVTINRLMNNNSIPRFCYYAPDVDCQPIEALMNNQDRTCTVFGMSMTMNQWALPFDYEKENQYPPMDYIYNSNQDTFDMSIVVNTSGASQDDRTSAIQVAKEIGYLQAKEYHDAYKVVDKIYNDNDDRAAYNRHVVRILRNMIYCWAGLLFIVTMFWFSWCIPVTRLFLICKVNICMRLPIFGPDWLDFCIWFGFWIGMFIYIGLQDHILVQGIILFTVSFLDLILSCYYCCRWKRRKCCPGGFCKECCADLKPNNPNNEKSIDDIMNMGCVELTSQNSYNAKRMPSRQSTYMDEDGRKVYNSTGNDRDVCECRCAQVLGARGRRIDKAMGQCCFPLHSSPDKMHRWQGRTVFTLALLVALLAGFTTIVCFVIWDVSYYKALIRKTRTIEEEYTPSIIIKFQAFLYAEPGKFDQVGWDDDLFDFATKQCKSHFGDSLSNSEKKEQIYDAYIDKYSISMDIFDRTHYTEYETVNDWFSRELQPLNDSTRPVRPIDGEGDYNIVVSPADCRVVVFQEVQDDQLIWIKSKRYNTNRLLDMVPGSVNDAYNRCQKCLRAFQNMKVQQGMFRLAPQDYHRYHAPVTGKVILGFEAGSKLHSVSADAITSENEAILNKRYVLFIEMEDWPKRTINGGAPQNAVMVYVIIGAICVGSINMQAPADMTSAVNSAACGANFIPDQYPDKESFALSESDDPAWLEQCEFQKGECTGTFKFGGSTIAMVFQEDAIIWDQDLLFTSYFPVENVLTMGSQIARVNPTPVFSE